MTHLEVLHAVARAIGKAAQPIHDAFRAARDAEQAIINVAPLAYDKGRPWVPMTDAEERATNVVSAARVERAIVDRIERDAWEEFYTVFDATDAVTTPA